MNIKSILKELTNVETEYYTIYDAWIENGSVYIHGTIKANVNGEKYYNLLPNKYSPREIIYASYGCSNSIDNITRIGYIRIESNGQLSLWLQNANAREHFTFVYPLKVQ